MNLWLFFCITNYKLQKVLKVPQLFWGGVCAGVKNRVKVKFDNPPKTSDECNFATRRKLHNKVKRIGSNTFGDLFIQKVLQNQPSSPIIGILWCFAQLCGNVEKCQNLTFKVNILCQKSSESYFFFNEK